VRKSKYTLEVLEPLVKSSKSLAEVIRKLGLAQSGGVHRMLKHRIVLLELDISHFTGSGWSKGSTRDTNELINRISCKNEFSNDEVFTENSPVITGTKLRKRLLKLGWEYKCKVCELNSWLGQPLTLHLDHINGIHNDNRLENLRFLCPNCHQQTDTWGNKNL
jgi:hypothetical protein